MLELYEKYHLNKDYTSIGLFRTLKQKYNITKVLYPGSHVHITPSLIFEDVVYADSFKNTFKFFESKAILDYINSKKEYTEPSIFKFYQQDYREKLEKEIEDSFDLVISQYAGFVGQAVKTYLKKGGLLVCNDSHGDASMAFIDPDYELIAVYNRKADDKFSISEKNLEDYFIPKKSITITKELLIKNQRGIGYTKTPSGYIFRKK